MKAIRVLHVTTSSQIGGAERLIASLCRATSSDAAALEVVTLGPPGPLTDELTRDGFICHSLNVRGSIDMPLAIGRLTALIRRRHVDVVHGHLLHGSAAGMAAALVARAPLRVMTRHYSRALQAYGSAFDRALDRMTNRIATRIFAVGETVRDVLVNDEHVDTKKVVVIRNGIDVAMVRRAAGLPTTRSPIPSIGTVGSLHRFKGHEIAFDALDKLRRSGLRVRYELVGEGPMHDELVALAARLGLGDDVAFLGFLADPYPRVSSWDIYVQPSLQEGLSVAVLEAMALGKPVICTATGEMAHVVDGTTTGLLVPPGDADALASAIARVRDDAALAARLGDAARSRVERDFDISVTARAYLDGYGALL